MKEIQYGGEYIENIGRKKKTFKDLPLNPSRKAWNN